jgi:pyridinium-3,5-biscarboxylic acid mononucleotide sulfurtransferase
MSSSLSYVSSMIQELDFQSPKENLLKLKNWFLQFDSALVAFSAGVDSSVLACAARQALSRKAIAVTSVSPSFARSEIDQARQIANEIGIELIVVSQQDLATKDYVANLVNRCYFCRLNLVQAIMPIVEERKISICVDGTHLDDMKSPRPGVKALREARFRAPFVELALCKEEIRAIARILKLSNAEKPSEACLSSRIAYGQKIDEHTLRQIEESEIFIRELVGAKIVRVRTIETRAVVELDRESIHKAIKSFSKIQETLISLGYTSVEIDPNGYASGRMLDLFIRDNF